MIDFLFPSKCLICQKPIKPICDICLEDLKLAPKLEKGVMSVTYLTEYSQEMGKLLTWIKDKGVTSLINRLVRPEQLKSGYPQVLLVPIPSSATNYKRRGFSHTLLVAKTLARGRSDAKVFEVLASSKLRQDQTALGLVERKRNLEGAFKVKAGAPKDIPVILVDDVYTTGATAMEAARTLSEAGFQVLGCWVLAKAQGQKAN